MKKLLHFFFLLALVCYAANVFAQAVTTTNKPAPVDSATRVKQIQKNIENFTNDLDNAQNEGKSTATIHLLRGINEASLKQFDKALKDYSAAIKLFPDMKEPYPYRAAVYEAVKNYADAIQDYETCLSFAKDNKRTTALCYNNIGRLQFKLRQYKKAITSDSTAISLDPFLYEPYLYRAWSYAASGKDELAILDYTVAIGGYQNNKKRLSIIFSGRGDSKMRLKKYKEAINDFNYSVELDPNHKDAIWNRAACYYYNGDYQLADEDFNKLIVYFKNDNKSLAKLYDDRAIIEMGIQQYKKAIADDSLSISFNNQFGIAYWHKADAYSENADFQLSIDWYNKAMPFYQDEKRSLALLYSNIANEEYFLNDYQKVIDYSTSAIKLDTQYWISYLNRGKAYLKEMNKEQAMNDFNKILSMDTSKISYEYAFALFYTGKPDKAIEVIQKNVLATTNNYTLLIHYYNLACLFSLMNKPDEANVYLKKCIDGGYPKKYVLADSDLDNIRNTAEYKDAMR